MHLQFRDRRDAAVLNQAIWEFVCPGDVEILVEAERRGGVYKIAVPFLIEDALYGAGGWIEGDAIVRIFQFLLSRGFFAGLRRAEREGFVADRWNLFGHKANVIVRPATGEQFERDFMARC